MTMMRVIGLLALCGAVGAKQDSVNLMFPAEWKPDGVAASIVNVGPTATTFALGCPTKANDDCSVYIPTITQGPKIWAYSGEWEDIMGVDE